MIKDNIHVVLDHRSYERLVSHHLSVLCRCCVCTCDKWEHHERGQRGQLAASPGVHPSFVVHLCLDSSMEFIKSDCWCRLSMSIVYVNVDGLNWILLTCILTCMHALTCILTCMQALQYIMPIRAEFGPIIQIMWKMVISVLYFLVPAAILMIGIATAINVLLRDYGRWYDAFAWSWQLSIAYIAWLGADVAGYQGLVQVFLKMMQTQLQVSWWPACILLYVSLISDHSLTYRCTTAASAIWLDNLW